jgi:hypothetical protein
MMNAIALGFDGLAIPPGSHICALFRGIDERDQILVPFLREGLRAGHKCTCIIDDGVEDVRVAVSRLTTIGQRIMRAIDPDDRCLDHPG